jgi:tetratricopeptide (TPR) repeat protein
MDVLFGSVPDQYKWITGLLGLTGNIDRGLGDLEEVFVNNGVYAIEAGIWLSLIRAYLLQQFDEAILYVSQLRSELPESLLIAFISSSVHMKNAQSDSALHILEYFDDKTADYMGFPYLQYIRGEIHLQKGCYRRALEAYALFMESHDGPNLIKVSYFKMSICCHLLNLKPQAETYWKLARDHGTTSTEVDKNADFMLKDNDLPQKHLIKARYHTDGGYFDKAFEVLKTITPRDLTTRKEKTEYMYRFARLYHKTRQTNNAETYYQRVLELQGREPWYYAPNACLQLARIYYADAQYEKAGNMVRNMRKYTGYPYAGSIRNKAALLEAKINAEQ